MFMGGKSTIFIGDRFGKLVVIEKSPKKDDTHTFWLCKCDCGNISTVRANSLRRNTQSCGCIRKAICKERCWKGCGELSGSVFFNLKRSALKRKLEFSVSIEYLSSLFISQNKKCAISNLDISFGKKASDRRSASLDRIDNNRGYTIDNVQWVHKDVNYMKSYLTEERLIYLCKKIIEHNEKH